MGAKKEDAPELASPAERVQALFRHFHPRRVNVNGGQAWFRRELANRDIIVTGKTISLWFKNGIPADREEAIVEVIATLEGVMIGDLEAKLSQARRAGKVTS